MNDTALAFGGNPNVSFVAKRNRESSSWLSAVRGTRGLILPLDRAVPWGMLNVEWERASLCRLELHIDVLVKRDAATIFPTTAASSMERSIA